MKNTMIALISALALTMSLSAKAAEYEIDVKGAHAFVTFKIKHLGYSWLLGRFNDFKGDFYYDASAPEKSRISVEIETASIDSNHAERDKHLRSDDFLDVKKYPKASFNSTKFEVIDANNANVTGDFTLHGVTKSITFPVEKIGEGKDPWGGYRAGFSGATTLKLGDYGIPEKLGPASTMVEIGLHIEGIRK